tara:strand:+ start:1496 stop:5221 length:3726 start_codon:yes stop_codon:yes gene_type:complete
MPQKRYTFEELSPFKSDTIEPKRYSFDNLSKPRTQLEDSFLDEWMPDWIKKGYNESITGMAEKIVTGEERFDLGNYKPTILGDIGSAIAGFLMPADLAATFAGAGIGSLATRAAAKTALSKAAKIGAKRLITFGSSKQFADKVMESGAKRLLTGASVQAGALSTYTGLNEALKQEIKDGDVDWSDVLTESSKAALSGAVGGAIFGRAITRGAKTSSALAQEAIGFGTADPILRGEMPSPEDYISGLGVVLGISAAKALPRTVKNYVKGVTSEYRGVKVDPENRLSVADKNNIRQVSELAATQEWLAKQGSEVWNTMPNIKGKYIPEVKIMEEIPINVPTNKKLYDQSRLELKTLMGREAVPTVEQIKSKYINLYKNSEAQKVNQGIASPALRALFFPDSAKPQKKVKPGDIPIEDAFKDIPGFRIRQEGGVKEIKLSRKEFYSTYQRNQIVRQNSEQLSVKLKQSLKLSDEVFSQELGNVPISRVSDAQLREINKRLYTRYKVETHYKTFVEHSADLPTKDIFDHVLGEDVALYFKTFNKSFKDEGSRAVVQLMRTSNENRVSRVSSQMSNLKKSPVFDLYKDKKLMIEVYREHVGLAPRTKANKKYTDWLDDWGEESYNYAGKANIVRAGKIKGYLPIIYKPAIRDALFNDFMTIEQKFNKVFDKSLVGEPVQRNFEQMIRAMINRKEVSQSTIGILNSLKKTYNINYEKAYKLLESDILPDKINPYNAIEKSRKYEITDDLLPFLETDLRALVTVYDERLARRAETVKIFGRNNETLRGMTLEIAKRKPNEAKLLNEGIDKLTGAIEKDPLKMYSPRVRKFFENVMAFEAMTKISLGTATVANLTQPLISIVTNLGLGRTIKGFARLSNKKVREGIPTPQVDFLREMLGEVGSGSLMRKASDKLATVSGFTGINKFNNLLSASTAEIAIKDYIKMFNRNPNSIRGKYAQSKLKKLFNISVKEGVDVSEGSVVSAMTNFAKSSQLQRDFLSEPFWASNPKARPFIMFKSFGYKQAGMINESIKREMKLGNPLIFLRLGMAGMAGGSFVNWAKDGIYTFLSGREVYNEKDTKMNEFIENMSSVGTFGMLTDFIDAENFYGSVEFVVTPPFISDLKIGFNALQTLTKELDEWGFTQTPFRKALYKASPILGSLPKRVAERYIATEQQKRDSEKTKKGKVRIKIIELLVEGKANLAIEKIKQWNGVHPYNALTYDSIGHRAIYQRALQKNMKKIKENLPSFIR